MRILFVSVTFPVPADSGLKMRTWDVLQALAAEGHDITFLAFTNPNEWSDDLDSVGGICSDMQAVPLALTNMSAGGDYVGRFESLFSLLPYAVTRFRSDVLRDLIVRRLHGQKYELILCDLPHSIINVPKMLSIPVVINAHNVEHLVLQRYLAYERNLIRKAYAWLEARKLRRWERYAYSRANLAMVCSQYDKFLIKSLCSKVPVAVVPNVVNVERYAPSGNGNGSRLLYTGGMDWYPNRDAVEFFVFRVLPQLRTLRDKVSFTVAGRNPPHGFLKRLTRVAGVEFTGTVPDMRDEIAKATICVVPLRIGSGTRLKILEAAAMAKAIVSTNVGAEGLEFVDGEEIILADEPQAIAQAIAGLLDDPPRRRKLGWAARKRVEQQYSLPVLQTALRNALAKLT